MSEPAPDGPPTVSREDEPVVLALGDMEIRGRIMPASNLTGLAEGTYEGKSLSCVYKPISGERPLWDFPDGTLAAREVAAHAVSEAIGWDIVPLTVLREGPAGPGMVQVWRGADPPPDPGDPGPLGSGPGGGAPPPPPPPR